MKFLRNYIEKQKNKSFWAWVSDILFGLFVLAMLIPSTRTPLMVFIKKISMFSPSVSVDDHYGKLSSSDYQWQIKDDKGNILQLKSFQGKPIFINFWATWCPPCIAEMPAITALEKDYSDKVYFLLVSNENHQITERFLKDKELTIKTYQAYSQPPKLLSSKSIPTTFIVNKDGEILVKKTGSSNWNGESVRELLDKLIAE